MLHFASIVPLLSSIIPVVVLNNVLSVVASILNVGTVNIVVVSTAGSQVSNMQFNLLLRANCSADLSDSIGTYMS